MTASGKRLQESPAGRSRVVAVARRHPWLTAAEATLVCAGGLLAADAVFFAGFGLTPWQVGHSAIELLLQAPLLLLLLVAGGTLGNLERAARRTGWRVAPGFLAEIPADFARIGWVLLAIAIGLAWLVAPVEAAWARARVRDGQTVWMDPSWPRPFQVVAARVTGLPGYLPPAAVTSDGTRLLAASPDRYWLYVPATGETIDVPTKQVILMIKPKLRG